MRDRHRTGSSFNICKKYLGYYKPYIMKESLERGERGKHKRLEMHTATEVERSLTEETDCFN